MSNPLSSLGKSRKTPLFLPDISTPLPSLSAYDIPGTSSSHNHLDNLNQNASQSLSPFSKIGIPADLQSSRENRENAGSSLSNYNSKSPLPQISRKNSDSLFSIEKSYINREQPSSRLPFKSNIDDSDLLDDVTSNLAINNMKRNYATNSKASNSEKSNKQAPNDMELMQIMMKKIKNTEAKCALLEKESVEKDKKIKILENKLELYKKAKSQAENETIRDLEKKNSRLLDKINDMEKFLADYGLYWVGEKNDENESDEETLIDINLTNNSNNRVYMNKNNEFKCDFDLLIKNAKELNSLTDENEPKIVEFRNGAKFETTKSIKLTLYSNGICLFDGPFRSFDEALTKKFCIDIMDGYFPSELQSNYPDGVPFDVIDKRDVFFKDERSSLLKTKGYRLGSDDISNDDESNKSNSKPKCVENKLHDKPLSMEQFLNKLPSNVIKNGKLIDVRNDLSNLINGSVKNDTKEIASQVSVIETSALEELRKSHPGIVDQKDLLKINSTDQNVKLTTIRVKNLSGNNCLLVKLKSTDTIQTLKNYIKTKTLYTNFDLETIYPKKILKDLSQTLAECNLEQNSNIILIPRNK